MLPAADEVCEVIITAPDRWQARSKTRPRAVALRTRRSLLPQIVDRAKREHPYEVPSVVAIPIIDGGPDYIGWILEQTDEPA